MFPRVGVWGSKDSVLGLYVHRRAPYAPELRKRAGQARRASDRVLPA